MRRKKAVYGLRDPACSEGEARGLEMVGMDGVWGMLCVVVRRMVGMLVG